MRCITCPYNPACVNLVNLVQFVSNLHSEEETDWWQLLPNPVANTREIGVRVVLSYVSHYSSVCQWFIARRLLHNGSCVACKACLMSKAPSSADDYIGFKECSSTVHSLTYPTEKLVWTVGTAVTVLEGMISEVAHTDAVESCITNAIKESISFDWITLTGCPLHHQRTEDEIVRSITRISIPWWCKQKNESSVEASRRKALKRKLR